MSESIAYRSSPRVPGAPPERPMPDEAHPASELSLDVTIDFPHPVIGRQEGLYDVTEESFETELSTARTFGFVREVEALRAKGLIRGAWTQIGVVLVEAGVVEYSLLSPDVFVRL